MQPQSAVPPDAQCCKRRSGQRVLSNGCVRRRRTRQTRRASQRLPESRRPSEASVAHSKPHVPCLIEDITPCPAARGHCPDTVPRIPQTHRRKFADQFPSSRHFAQAPLFRRPPTATLYPFRFPAAQSGVESRDLLVAQRFGRIQARSAARRQHLSPPVSNGAWRNRTGYPGSVGC